MDENLRRLKQVFIVFLGGKYEEYYFDNERNTIGKFMDEGWGRFYNLTSKRWEWINMNMIVKFYYGDEEQV